MRLTMTDKTEIKKIIASFNDDDKDRVKKLTETLCPHIRPILNLLEDYNPDDYTKLAVQLLGGEDCDFQEFAGEVMWDLFHKRVEWEYAIGIFLRRHTFEDAA